MQVKALAKSKASAYLEYHFLQDALANPFGHPPEGHVEEYVHRVKAAIELDMAARLQAYKALAYNVAFLITGAKQSPGQEAPPIWAPCSVLHQLKAMGPKTRTMLACPDLLS